MSTDPEGLLSERYVLSDQAPATDPYDPTRRYGVWDYARATWALLPNAVLCWALTLSEAGDALVELRAGLLARSLRDDA